MVSCTEDLLLDVVIIGGGWSGILACKQCLQEGLTLKLFEARENIGGIWCFSDSKEIATVMKTTRASSSATVTEMSDFQMPREIGEFPHHKDVLKYLHNYCDAFNLHEHIQLKTRVKEVKKENEIWCTITDKNEIVKSSKLIVCTGIHQFPDRSVENTVFKGYTGKIIHSGEIKEYDSSWSGKRILIFGGGETASDIVENWYLGSNCIFWCIPRGQHFFRKYAKLLPYRKPQALDKASSRALKCVSPFTKSKPGISWACKWTTNGSLLAYQGHGIPEWKNGASFFHSFINKQGHVLDYVDYKKVVPKRRIVAVSGSSVTFDDSNVEEVDAIILCTGYKLKFPFLPQGYQSAEMCLKYKFVFDAADPSLAFVGYTRPIVGSIPSIAEAQSRWVARVFSGRVTVASEQERKQTIINDLRFWEKYFEGTSHRLKTLVEGYTYTDDIAKLSKCYPDYWSLFCSSPRDFMTAYFGPYNGCSLLLNEGSHRKEALATIKRHSENTMSPFFLLLFLFLRIICFDWILEKIADLKFFIQTSTRWQKIRCHKLVKAADSIWVIPKKYLFDTKHYN